MKMTIFTGLNCAVILALAAVLVSCRVVAMDDSTPPLSQLEIGNTEVSNWKPEARMKVYIGTELFNFNDGAAPKYLDKGCLRTGAQRLNGQDGAIVQTTVMDFGKPINATAMFTEMQLSNVGSAIKDPVFPDTTVSVASILGGVQGCAHFENYYIELSVTGFADEVLALKTFDLFVGLYAKKINP